ncbi:MAG: lysophospholipid acyltransferase family protein [Desulfotignum sp.]|nr:lysophospholipid acyltransferase family protein [Desulfotignum sp.]MCF8113337.1 lysophospholipid acyltransferase family protein [Desulfotignum sp.]MCF8125828.1 lysophospholipid acyltransferase family protein [Desulfotignum sp.]
MLKRLKFVIYTRPFIWFAFYLVKYYSRTLRLRVENENHWKKMLEQRIPVLLCAWHQQFFAAINHFGNYARYHPGLMISRSRDGDLISGVANRVGWHTPRGSSSRGGKDAMNAMIAHLKQYGFGAHILDGPRGPMGKIKPGVIRMAHAAGARVVPFYVTADNAWFFNSWDRFMLPKPFSRVCITFGQDIVLEPVDTPEQFEQQRRYLENLLLPRLFHLQKKE